MSCTMKIPCLHASSFAAFIGKHPYEKHHEAFEKVWQRTSPETYAQALQRHKKTTRDQQVEALKSSVPELQQTFQQAKAIGKERDSSAEVCDMQKQLYDVVSAKVQSDDDRKLVEEALRKELFTSFGTSNERSVLDILEHDCHFELDDGVTDVVYAKTYETPKRKVPWKLVGKIDACTKDGSLLIEVKNRMHRLFMKAPEYERIQVETYLQLHETAERALLVESLKHNGSRTINIIPIDANNALWDECHSKAHAMIDFLSLLVDDIQLQDAYMTSKRPSAFLKAFF